MISDYLKECSHIEDESIHLLFSANRWEQKQSILEALNSGKTLICDRYAYSGVAFSSAKGLDFNWCKAPDMNLPRPDLVLFLDVTTNQLKSRPGYGEERYEKVEFQDKVYEQF